MEVFSEISLWAFFKPSLPAAIEVAGLITPLLAIGVLLVMSGLISASEVAYFLLRPEQIDGFRSSEKTDEQLMVKLIDDPRRLLATILIMNNLVNVGIVTISTYFTWQMLGTSGGEGNAFAILILTLSTTSAIVFFGEILPKVFATQKSVQIARLMSRPLSLVSALTRPLTWMLMSMSDIVEKKIKKVGYSISLNELNEALDLTTDKNTSIEEKEILKGIVNFSSISVKQIMRSRIDITALGKETTFAAILDKINDCRYSRIPIYSETIDKIDGIIYIKDLLPFLDEPQGFVWQDYIRHDTFFVPENKKIDDLLRDFQERRVHMAIVVDEYGGTAGLITLEDIIEEIVGDINDEFDDDSVAYKVIDAATFVFDGKTSLNDFCKIAGVEPRIFAEVKGDSESLGGLLLELFARMPKAGEKINFGPFLFTVVSVVKTRIISVRVLIQKSHQEMVG